MTEAKKQPVTAVVAFTSTSDNSDAPVLDLNKYITKHPNSTFFMRVEGDGWKDEGIYSGDIVAIDRSIEPKQNAIVVAVSDGELVLRRLNKSEKVEVWGVVCSVIRRFG